MWEDPEVIAALDQWVAPDVACRVPSNAMMGGEYQGIDGFLRMQREWIEDFSEIHYKVIELTEAENAVIAEVFYRGRGLRSGAETSGTWWWRQEYADGRMTSFEIVRRREDLRPLS